MIHGTSIPSTMNALTSPICQRALEIVIGYLIRGGRAQAAVELLDDLVEEAGYPLAPARQFIAILVNVHLVGWVAGSITQRVDHDAAVGWVTERLGPDAGAAAAGLITMIKSPQASRAGEQDRDPSEFIAAAVWLCAGMVATAGSGDVGWLSSLEPAVPGQVR